MTISANNNVPTASDGAVTTTENTAYTFTPDDFNFEDDDTDDGLDVSWTAPADGGSAITSYDLRYCAGSATDCDTDSDFTNGPQDVTGTSTAISSLDADTEYQVQVRATNAEGDSGWSASGTGSTSAPGNSAPTASNGAVSTPENVPYTFSADDFNFSDSDSGDSLQKVRIVTLPGEGKITAGGITVTANTEISRSDIDINDLHFVPVTDAIGSPYTTFTFKVSDGTDESVSAYTMTVNVTATPSVSEVAVTSTPQAESLTYGAGEKIRFTVTFTRAVEVSTSRPHFEFWLGSPGDVEIREASYESGTGTTALVFAYTVQAGDTDTDGIRIGDQTHTIMFDTGEYIRGLGNGPNAVLTHTFLGTQFSHRVDGSLTPGNSPPVFADTMLARSIAENTGANTNVGAVIPAATDSDTTDTLIYSMEGADKDSFNFDVSSRQITTRTGVTYDFEAKSSYSVTIKVSDGTASDTVAVTISVTDVDEPPADMTRPDGEPGDLRLAEQRTVSGGGVMGRLEFFGSDARSDAAWGTVCDDRQDHPGNLAPAVACRLMGYGGGHFESAPGNARRIHFDDQPIWLDDLVCLAGSTHSPTTLEECFHAGVGLHNCEHEEDLWVVCTGEPGDWTDATNLVGELPALSVASAGAAEHLHDKLVFTVSLVPAATMTVTVDYATSDGAAHDDSFPKAVAGEDYTAMNGTLTFAPGETEKTIEVPITDDDIEDSGEIMTLTLSNPAGAQFSRPVATGIIFNHEDNTPGDEEDTEVGTDSGPALTAALLDAPADGHGGSAFALTLRFSEEFPLSFRTLRDSALSVTNGTLTGVARTTAGENREWSLERRTATRP